MSQPIRKVLISGAGDIDMLSIVSSTIEPPPPEHAQIRPIYSGFSGSDINMRRGVYPLQEKAPLTPGYCLAGTVVALGPKCPSRLKVGQMVACLTVYDSQSTLVNLPEKYLIPIPQDPATGKYLVDPQSATAVMLDWTTAYGLLEDGNIRKDQRVFIHGMSGAVGWALFKLCRMRGAVVYGTASASKHALIRENGGHPFVYTDKKWMAEMRNLGGANVVYDALGFESWDESYDILHRSDCPWTRDPLGTNSGLLVGFGGNLQSLNTSNPGEKPPPQRSQVLQMGRLLAMNAKVWDSRSTHFYYITRDDKSFVPSVDKIFQLIAQGEVEIPIKKIWEMEDIKEAHSSWGKGDGVGSILVKINEE